MNSTDKKTAKHSLKVLSATCICGALLLLAGCGGNQSSSTSSSNTSSAETSSSTSSKESSTSQATSASSEKTQESSQQTQESSQQGPVTWGDGSLDDSAEVNKKLAEDSIVLLKNKNNALPIATSEQSKTMVSVFGRDASDFFYAGGGSGTGEDAWKEHRRGYSNISIYDGLEEANFSVNQQVKGVYDAYEGKADKKYCTSSTMAPNEMPVSELSGVNISPAAKQGVALIVFGRTGSEGGDLNTGSYELKDDGTFTETTKHALKLSDDEEALISYVKGQNFSKVVVVLNIPMAFECDPLESDDKIDSVLWIGHPGINGLLAVGEVLNGTVNPSGRLADIYAKDFTKDPTFVNVENNTHITKGEKSGTFTYFYDNGEEGDAKLSGSWSGVEYEEGIYYGYRYYETRSATEDEKPGANKGAWYKNNVVYPFGYGLSYTDFEWKDMTVTPKGEDHDGYSDVYYEVKVTVENKGQVAGKDVVELYYTSPYTSGGIEKSHVELADFAKTKLLAPGESERLTLTVYKQDMASFDYEDANKNNFQGYELEAGTYELKLQANSHDVKLKKDLVIDSDVQFTKDRHTQEGIEERFSSQDGYNSLGAVVAKDKRGGAGDMTQLSRADWEGTFPSVPLWTDVQTVTTSGWGGTQTTEKKGINCGVEQSNAIISAKSLKTTSGKLAGGDNEANSPWAPYYNEAVKKFITDGIDDGKGGKVKWTQAADDKAPVSVKYEQLVGKSFDDPLWETFMNQMTWEELADYVNVSIYTNKGFERLGIWSTDHADGPVCMHHQYDASIHGWQYVATINVASTWNKDLALTQGLSFGNEALAMDEQGWYAPGLNLHRSPFGGRNFEYYAEDGVLAGKIAAEVCKGIQSKGVNAFVKHFAVNNQETDRGGLITYLNEQDLRQNYLKAFQLCIQDGGALAMMVSMNCVGNVSTYNNWHLTHGILREEWGFLGEITTDIISAPSENAFNTELTMYRRCGISNGLLLGSLKTSLSSWDAQNGCVVVGDARNDFEWASIRLGVKYALYANVNTNEKDNPTYDNRGGFNGGGEGPGGKDEGGKDSGQGGEGSGEGPGGGEGFPQ